MTTQHIVRESGDVPYSQQTKRFSALTALGRRQTWSEFSYAVLGLPIGVATFTLAVTALSVNASLVVTVIGVPLVALTGLASRWLGSKLRSFANVLIATDVPPAQPFTAKPGFVGWIRSCLADGTAWRAQLYLVLKLPVGVTTFTAAVTLYASGLAGLTYWAWRPFTGCVSGSGATCHHAPRFGVHHLDAPFGRFLTSVAGLALMLLTPWVIRALLAVDKRLVATLLGPSRRYAEAHASLRGDS
jgi:hypothetical protein